MNKKRGCLFAAGIFASILAYVGFRFGPDALTAYRQGFLDEPTKKKYQGDSLANLKALHTSLLLYHDSEGAFPDASGWMDAASRNLQTNDLEKGEGLKKLVRPGGRDGDFGYAFNDAASRKYKDDIKDPKSTPLVFESKDGSRNAHGDPANLRDGMAISVDGTLLK